MRSEIGVARSLNDLRVMEQQLGFYKGTLQL